MYGGSEPGDRHVGEFSGDSGHSRPQHAEAELDLGSCRGGQLGVDGEVFAVEPDHFPGEESADRGEVFACRGQRTAVGGAQDALLEAARSRSEAGDGGVPGGHGQGSGLEGRLVGVAEGHQGDA